MPKNPVERLNILLNNKYFPHNFYEYMTVDSLVMCYLFYVIY